MKVSFRVVTAFNLFFSLLIYAQVPEAPSIGDGTITNPYQISSLQNLYWITDTDTVWDKYFIQTADINASETRKWSDGKGWSAIGLQDNVSYLPFTGTYNGCGYTIDSLYINRPETYCIGLFGFTEGAKIDSINLDNITVIGDWGIGGLIGFSGGTSICAVSCNGSISGRHGVGGLVGVNYKSFICNSFSSGEVFSSSEYVGGLVGDNRSSAISRCYSIANVTGLKSVGGLIGNNFHSSINNCYSRGQVSGTDYVGGLIGIIGDVNLHDETSIVNCYSAGKVEGNDNVGGLIGSTNLLAVKNSFWDIETSNQATSNGGSGKITYDMKMAFTFAYAGWSNSVWYMDSLNDGYPYLSWQNSNGTPIPSDEIIEQPSGDGTSENPYRIATLKHLFWLSLMDTVWNKNFLQTADINAAETWKWPNGEGMTPIGNSNIPFTGTYNGLGHIIDSLNFNHQAANRQGMFGYIQNAVIENVGIERISVKGNYNIGGLVGFGTNAIIRYCYCTGTVSGYRQVGGLVGYSDSNSLINDCFSRCDVLGTSTVGGLVGVNKQ